MTSLIDLSQITRSFPPTTRALRNVTFSISPGQSVAITGPSGSGKSTLLGILGLLDSPDSGAYTLEGTHVESLTQRQKTEVRKTSIGHIFQAFNLIDYLSVRENILHSLDIKGLHGAAAAARADTTLAQVGLTHRADAYPPTLSGGEQQRTAIARALSADPKVLLCDEPTGNLDSTNSRTVLDLLLATLTPENTVIIVTHDPAIAAACDRQIVIEDGSVTHDSERS